MDTNEAARTGVAEQPAAEHTVASPTGAVARRRLLLAGTAGAAVSLLPFMTRRAAASTDTTEATADTTAATGDAASEVTTGGSPTESAVTTTTAPPKRPTDNDLELLAFIQSIELATRDLYKAAIAGGVFSGGIGEAVKAIAEDHEAYAQAISGLIGRNAPNERDAALFDELEADFAGDAASVAAAARSLEDNLVATNIEAVGTLVGIDGSAMVAAMVVIEARHATALAHIAGVTDLADQLATEGTAIAAAAT